MDKNVSSVIYVGFPIYAPRGPGPYSCLVISLGRTQARGICSHHRELIPRPTLIGLWPALFSKFVVLFLSPVALMLRPGSFLVFKLIVLWPIVVFVEIPKIGWTPYLYLYRGRPPRFYDLELLPVVMWVEVWIWLVKMRNEILYCRWARCGYHKNWQAYIGRDHLRPTGVSLLGLKIFDIGCHGFLICRRKYWGPLSIREYLDRGLLYRCKLLDKRPLSSW